MNTKKTNYSISNYSGSVRLQKAIKGLYRTQMGLTNSFTLIESTMRLVTLALLIILPAAEYAAARSQRNSLEYRQSCANFLEHCSGVPCCDSSMTCGYFFYEGDANDQGASVRHL